MKINRYKLTPDFINLSQEKQIKFLLANGFKEGFWGAQKDGREHLWYSSTNFVIHRSIDCNVTVDLLHLDEWNDYDYIAIDDDDFGQYYQPFYDCMIGKKQIGKNLWQNALKNTTKKWQFFVIFNFLCLENTHKESKMNNIFEYVLSSIDSNDFRNAYYDASEEEKRLFFELLIKKLYDAVY